MRRAAVLNDLGTLENPGDMSALPPTMTMRAGEVLTDYLSGLRKPFPEDTGYGGQYGQIDALRAIGDFFLEPSEQMAGEMVEGNPYAVFDTRAGRQWMNPALLEALGLAPFGAVAKAPGTLIPGGMFAASKALERGLGVPKAGQGDDFNFSDFLLALGLGNDPRTSVLGVIEGKSFPKKLTERTKVDAYNPDKAGTNVAVIPKKKGTSGLTLEGQEIRRLNNEIARTRKKVKDAEKANNQQLVTENTQLELQLTNQKKNYLAELGKQYEGKVYFWEGDKFLDMQSGQDIGESIVDGVNIGVDRSGMIVDKKAPAKVFMTVGEGITEPGSTRLTCFKKTNKENSVIATNLRVRSHFEWTDIKGERIKPPQGMEDQKIVSVAVGDKHYYTIDLKQQGPTYLLKEGVDAQTLQKGSVRGARGDATDNPHLKTVQVEDIYLNNSKNNILGYAITKTDKNKVAHPVYKKIHTVGNQMPDVN